MLIKGKKLVALLLSTLFVLCAVPAQFYAKAHTALVIAVNNMEVPKHYNSSSIEALEEVDYVDLDEFRAYMFEKFKTCPYSIDISHFNIEYNDKNLEEIRTFIWNYMPESFHVYALGASYYNDGIIKSITATYSYTAEEYAKMYKAVDAAANDMIKDLVNNNNLTDMQKVLILHDRLALWNDYDYDNYLADTMPQHDYNSYGALVLRSSVCQGYAEAFMLMLNRLGIANGYASSDTINHGWNIVYLYGEAYHVDVTHDDPIHAEGRVDHDNFLVSTQRYRENGHDAYDFDSTPTSTYFEDWFWVDSHAAMILLDNVIYYIDSEKETLNKYVDDTLYTLYNVEATWQALSGGHYVKNYACLSTDGEDLLYSLNDGIYAYEIDSDTATKIFTPSGVTKTNQVYGFMYEDGYLIYNLSEMPNFREPGSVYSKEKVPYTKAVKSISSISVYSLPDKTEYDVGETADMTGLILKVVYSDGSEKYVTSGYEIKGFNTVSAGEKTVTVMYKDKSATFSVTVTNKSGAVEYKQGDINSDGSISNFDYIIVRGYILGLTVLSDNQLYFADVNNDGVVTSFDYLLIRAHILGLTTIKGW